MRRPFVLKFAVACAFALLAAACSSSTSNSESARAGNSSASEGWYTPAVQALAGLNRNAEDLYSQGKSDDAAAVMEKARSISDRLLKAGRPTIEALRAASDLDDLHGRMLLANRHYGWARLMFQNNVARWKNWQPQTEETEQRRKKAEAQIAECDKHIE